MRNDVKEKSIPLKSCRYQMFFKRAPTQAISCKIFKLFKNTFFAEYLQWMLLACLEDIEELVLYRACSIDLIK